MPIYINGKEINTSPNNEPEKPTLKIDSIEADSTFTHDGSVEVTGDIGYGAKVFIKNGNITVHGNVEDTASIETFESKQSNNNSFNIVSGGVSISMTSSSNSGSIFIKGKIGRCIKLDSSHNIEIKDSESSLDAKSGHSFIAHKVGANSEIKSDHNIEVDSIGQGSIVTSGHNLNLASIANNCVVQSGHNLNASRVGKKCVVVSGHNLNVAIADDTATLTAGYKKNVGYKTSLDIEEPKQENTPVKKEPAQDNRSKQEKIKAYRKTINRTNKR